MILICGIPTETPVRLLVESAERLGLDALVLNQREAAHCQLDLGSDAGGVTGSICAQGREVPLEAITGVYVRLMDHTHLPESRRPAVLEADPYCRVRSAWLHQSLVAWLEATTTRVMNRASAMASNVSKPYQALLIQQVGFDVPPTLITNDRAQLEAFCAEHRRVIYKSISSIRSIVRELDANEPRLAHLHRLPTQFQAFIPGDNVRVHVVSDAVFATEIRSDAVDYRYAGRDGTDAAMRPWRLPAAIERRCLELSRLLRLPLCGIDLKRTPDNDWYCFEVNPSPAYSYYQEQTGQPISDQIAWHLSGRDGLAPAVPLALGRPA